MYIKLKYSRIRESLIIFYKIKLIILLLFTSITVIAQKPSFRNYTNADGLPSNEVYMVMQDRQGYMWMATNYGVCRFDGYNFETYTTKDGLTDNTVFELFEDYKGRIWFITSNLKFSYFENNKIHPYKYNNLILSKVDNIPFIMNKSFYVDSNDNLMFSVYQKGIFIISSNGKIEQFFENNDKKKNLSFLKINEKKYLTYRILPFPDSLYIKIDSVLIPFKIEIQMPLYATIEVRYTSNKRLYIAMDSTVLFLNRDRLERFQLPDCILSINEDFLGNIWVGFRNGGASCYKNGDFRKEPYLNVLKDKPVSEIFSDIEGGLWFSTTTNGVYYTPSLHILSYDESEGLLSNQIINITNGKNDELMIFYRNNKYSLLKKNKISTINENISKDENIKKILNKYKKKWILTDRELYINENGKISSILDRYRGKIFNYYDKFIATSVLETDSITTYIADYSHIYKIKNEEVTCYTSPISLINFSNLSVDKNDIIYFGSKQGPGYIKNNQISFYKDNYPELKMGIYSTFYNNRDKTLWVATKGSGIYIINNDQLKNLSTQDGLSSNFIKHLFYKDNKIWVSTNAGIDVIFLSDKTDSAYRIVNINTSMGLISNEVNGIINGGKDIYVATDNGLSFFDPDELDFDKKDERSVKIVKFKINEKDTALLKKYDLAYNNNNIEIAFNLLSYPNAGKHIYQYRLKGLSDVWQETKSTEIHYAMLPPGKYQFEIKCLFPDNTVSKTAESVLFVINKPYWETWWFIILMTFLTLLLVYFLYRYRMKIIARQNKLKFQLIEYQSRALSSQINPHFIFNSLNSIQLYVLNNDSVKSNKYLSKFSRLMRNVLENSLETSITLEKEINTLTNYIEIELLRFSNKFKYTITTDPRLDLKRNRIPTLLIQPFVENAIWHGFMNKEGECFLSISLFDEETTIKCIIHDNGIGRKKSGEINAKKSSTHKSLGAQITKERITLLNNQFKNNLRITITDLYDSLGFSLGTKVEIILPKILK